MSTLWMTCLTVKHLVWDLTSKLFYEVEIILQMNTLTNRKRNATRKDSIQVKIKSGTWNSLILLSRPNHKIFLYTEQLCHKNFALTLIYFVKITRFVYILKELAILSFWYWNWVTTYFTLGMVLYTHA